MNTPGTGSYRCALEQGLLVLDPGFEREHRWQFDAEEFSACVDVSHKERAAIYEQTWQASWRQAKDERVAAVQYKQASL